MSAGSALIAAGLTLGGVEAFTLLWQIDLPNQYQLIAKGGDTIIAALLGILVAAVSLTLIAIRRLTRDLPLSFARRYLWPGLAALLTSYVGTWILAFWVILPVRLMNVPLRETIIWLLVGGALWAGIRLVRPSGSGAHGDSPLPGWHGQGNP